MAGGEQIRNRWCAVLAAAISKQHLNPPGAAFDCG